MLVIVVVLDVGLILVEEVVINRSNHVRVFHVWDLAAEDSRFLHEIDNDALVDVDKCCIEYMGFILFIRFVIGVIHGDLLFTHHLRIELKIFKEIPVLEVFRLLFILDETLHMLRDRVVKVFSEQELALSGVKLNVKIIVPSLECHGESAAISSLDIELETAFIVWSKLIVDLPEII